VSTLAARLPPRGQPARRAGQLGLLVLVGAGYAVATAALAHTTVPGLTLHEPAPGTLLPAETLRTARDVDRLLAFDQLARLLAPIAGLAFFAVRGPAYVSRSAAGRIGTGMLLAMLSFAVAWLAELPFSVAGLVIERAHGLASTDYPSFIIADFTTLGARFLFICLAVLIVMGLAAPLRRRWWLAAVPILAALTLLQAFVGPYLLPDVHDAGPVLSADAREIGALEHVADVPVKVLHTGQETAQPNAESGGLGPSRRVILWDTLFGAGFGGPERRAVLAHELGHLQRGHILKEVAWYALFTLPMAFVIALVTRRRGGLYQPASVPLAILVLSVLQLIALPVHNVVSRRYEVEADWISLQTTADPGAERQLFRALATDSRADPRPPTWEYLLFADHPTFVQRVAMVDAWAARRPRAG